jgi:hypothetical protein
MGLTELVVPFQGTTYSLGLSPWVGARGANPGLECIVLSGHRRSNGDVSHQRLEAHIPYPHLLLVPLPVVGLGLQIISPFNL